MSKGNVMFLSDKKDDLYYVDLTEVLGYRKKPGQTEKNYLSHAWALSKKGNILQKETVDVELKNNRNGYILNLETFDKAEFQINTIRTLEFQDANYDILNGTLINETSQKNVIGFSMNYDDSK